MCFFFNFCGQLPTPCKNFLRNLNDKGRGKLRKVYFLFYRTEKQFNGQNPLKNQKKRRKAQEQKINSQEIKIRRKKGKKEKSEGRG